MNWHHIAATASIFMELVASTPSAMAQNEPKVPIITMTANDLRAIGIAVRSAGASALPNSCAPTGTNDISVSDEMLASFKSRGFSLESLCLGLTSSFRYDPATGRPMPFAAVRNQLFPLNLPDCFNRAVPFLDCRWLYDHFWGGKSTDGADLLTVGQGIDAIARRNARTAGVVHSDCGKSTNPFGVEIAGRSVCILLEKVVFSAALPFGYGYAFRAPEGSDPEQENVDLSTYRKRSSVIMLWSDERSR